MHVGASSVILEIYKTVIEEECSSCIYLDEEWGKMKCYYLSKELNNCLEAMKCILTNGYSSS